MINKFNFHLKTDKSLCYSINKFRAYLTSKTGTLFYLTSSFSVNYKSKRKGLTKKNMISPIQYPEWESNPHT